MNSALTFNLIFMQLVMDWLTQGAFGLSLRNEFGAAVTLVGMGPARGGGSVTSYRAEACGMLPNLRFFLIIIAKFTEMQLPYWHGVVATDSQSVLDTLFGHDELCRGKGRDKPINLSGSRIFLNFLSPDWDVLPIKI